jgi:hypothetical protein
MFMNVPFDLRPFPAGTALLEPWLRGRGVRKVREWIKSIREPKLGMDKMYETREIR